MDIMKESDNDSESNHVLTYYKKYTQNPELCKYFTGPEASIKISTNPSLKKDVASINKASTSNDHINTISDNTNITEVNQDEDTEHKNISPSSSIASIKKLEWDNGADIGYNNSYKCSTIKSASFPSLFVNDTSYLNEENYISKNIKQVRSMYHQLTFVPEPECCSFQTKSSTLKTQIVDTSSNEAISKGHSSLSSGSEKNKLYLQKRIGQPNAYSTPYDEVSSKSSFNDLYKETPVIRGQEKPKRNLNENNSDRTSGNYIDSDKDVILYKTIDNSCSSSEPVSIEKHLPLDRNNCNENPIQQVNNVQREINLCLTKPIFVECIYSGNKFNMNKKSQKNSKSIQTESLQNDKKIIHYNSAKVCNPQIQKIEYIKYKNDVSNCDMFLDEEISLELKQTEPYTEETSEEGLCVVNDIKKSENGYKKKYLTTSAKMEDIQVITEKEYKEYQVGIDNNSKSEYVHEKSENLEVVNPIKASSFIGTNCSLSSQENSSVCSKFEKVLHQSESPVKENSPVTSNKSATDEMILAEMISLNQSRDLNTDIKRSINILQKLLNSKKYDEATKKYYIKKIVEKIVESKYSDDSTSSSEFFQPKKRNVVELSTQQKIGMPKNKSDKTMGSKIQLMQNIPWYPVHDTKSIAKTNSNIDCEVIKTDLYTDLKKGENTSPCFFKDDVDLVMDGKTSGDSENLNKLMVNSDCNVKHTVEIASSHRSVDHIVPNQPQFNDNTDQINNKNWKYIKTLSERLLENRDKIGQGDYLLKVATNERQHQLSWIKNEIKHLNKLKEMLERKLRPKTEMEGVISSLLKMHVDDVKGTNRGRSTHFDSRPTSEHRPPTSRTISSSSDSKSETKFPPTKKIPVDVSVGKDTNVKRKKKHKEGQRESNTANSNAPSESPQSHLKELDAGTENLENQAKKVQCCRACKTCKSTSPRPILVQGNDNENNRVLTRTSPSRDNDADKNQPVKCHPKCQDLKLKKTKSSVKKGCQCCTCTDCGSQTKRFGDKNARCQCCVCENCGIQASLDGNNRKPILSKWCQPKQAKTQVQRTISQPYSEQPPYRTQIISNQFEVYSSHNQARTDFRNSPQASNMDISPHSAKWFHNQAHTGDAVSVTHPNTKSQSKKCCCALDECKCCQTSTHEAKNVQYSAFKQCLCQTESKEETSTGCSCKAAVDVSCECKETPCKCAEDEVCKCKMSSTSSSNASSSSTSKSLMSCICCKKETVIKNLMTKIPLCNPCHQVNQKRFYPYEYSNPLHSCLCYSLVDQNTLCEIKSALTEIERLDIYQQYCEVLKNCKCCKKCGCKCKLPKKFKNGCAYFLKLEDACPYNCAEEMCDCEESSGKSDQERKENYLPEVTVKVQNCKGACARKKKSEYDIQQNCPSVMAYLCSLKPDFIERAERRRRILRSATLQREEDVETRKLRFLDQVKYLNEKCQNQNVSSETKISGMYGKQTTAYCVFDTDLNAPLRNIKPRVFKSFKEMKDLTRRKYLHLSEVKNKKDVYKNKRLKEANRILANTFTKRLQRSTLKGNVDIPPCVRVISY